MSEEIEIQPELIQHYPWLPSLKNVYSTISSLDPIVFIKKIFKTEKTQIEKRLLQLFNAAFNNIEYLTEYTSDQINIHIYIILKILLFVLNNNTITNRIANLYSKMNYEELRKENDFNIYAITRDLNHDVLYYQEPIKYKLNIVKDQKEILSTNFRIHYTDYLSLSSSL
ncbi:MAG: hypothetical protein GF317_12335, partial [Candidatus Lokiarchaeota archaeon]|nr:hypothetical protein [Candidatus Lokiarchaeota archaeon]MBD3200436.1 hypothetical protein [Candidatus Lokiarchaeota archaeon]